MTPGYGALRRAVRTALIMPAMFALGDKVLGNPVLGTFAAFGSFAMLRLVDFLAEPTCDGDSPFVVKRAYDYLVEPRISQRDMPPVGVGWMLSASCDQSESVLQQPEHARGSAPQHPARQAGDQRSVSGVADSDLEHHVANHDAPVGAQHASGLGQRSAFVGGAEVVKAVVGEDHVDRVVRERKLGRVADQHVDVGNRQAGQLIREMAAHRG